VAGEDGATKERGVAGEDGAAEERAAVAGEDRGTWPKKIEAVAGEDRGAVGGEDGATEECAAVAGEDRGARQWSQKIEAHNNSGGDAGLRHVRG
jgi:hypothetical protein